MTCRCNVSSFDLAPIRCGWEIHFGGVGSLLALLDWDSYIAACVQTTIRLIVSIPDSSATGRPVKELLPLTNKWLHTNRVVSIKRYQRSHHLHK
jgi:hypothetical protein